MIWFDQIELNVVPLKSVVLDSIRKPRLSNDKSPTFDLESVKGHYIKSALIWF